MGVYAGPKITSDGLVLALDAGNSKGFDDDENLLTYSKDFSAGWSSTLTVTLNNATAPDGTFTAAKIQRPINSGNSSILNHPALSTNTNYCYSAFIKLASTPDSTYSVCSLSSISDSISPGYASIGYNFVTGTISSFGNLPTTSGVIPYPNGWYRLYMVINTSSQTNALLEIRPLATNLVSDFYIWGAQLETGSSASPYYPTTGTAKNRGTTLIDMTGRGNTGTLTNSPTYNSSNGGSIVFDGVDDYAPIGTTGFPFGSSAGTLCAWCRTNTITGGFSWPISYGTASTGASRFLGISGSTYYFGGFGDDITASGVPLNTWFNMVGVYNGTNASMYINGVLVSGPTAKSWNTVANTAQLGRQTFAGEYWNGRIAQVSVYNRALSAAEIQQNFNATRGRFGI